MGKSRSPNYPSVSLPEAIEKARVLYQKEHRRKMAREAIAEHLGYGGLNGASVTLISALSKYGLLEGRGDEIRLSDEAITLIVDTPDSPDRQEALLRAATSPSLFAELFRHFEGSAPSDSTLRIYLQKNGFTPKAAHAASQAYKETMELVSFEGPSGEPSEMRVSEDRDERVTRVTQPDSQDSSRGLPSSVLRSGLQPIVFPLPRGNFIEIRLGGKMTSAEFEHLIQMLGFLRLSLVDDSVDQT